MTFHSRIPLEVGKVYTDWMVSDAEGNFHILPFKVLAISTYEKWLEDHRQNGYENLKHGRPEHYYYIISVD